MSFRNTIDPTVGKARKNAGKSYQEVVVSDSSISAVKMFRKNAGKVYEQSSQQIIEIARPQLMRVGGKLRASADGNIGGITPQTKTISYVNDGNYQGVFYEIGTELQTVSYGNPAFFLNQFKVSFVFADLLSGNQSLSPHRLLERPADFAMMRNPFHTSNGGQTYITVALPSGFRLKPTGFAMQSRTDFNSFHVTQLAILGCNNNNDSSNQYVNLGTYSTGFTVGSVGQWYVSTAISTTDYFDAFRITRTANNGSGTYFTGNFFEFFGELKIYL